MSNENSTTPAAPAAPSKMTVVNGGEPFVATMIGGNTEPLTIRLIPIRQMDEYLFRYEDIVGLVALATGKEPEFFDGMDEESLYALNRRVRELNDPRFDRWVSEKAATVGSKLKDLLKTLSGSR
ncbi:hypothetical protein [Geminisphaera colitermitum]|uniref:hypothetical protein n=1 Tax=Geminisphaera colitermitum TaxID=1148786 RepID=UPI000158D219|nr:hypothetical protein [Geminisphaera colitermitum]